MSLCYSEGQFIVAIDVMLVQAIKITGGKKLLIRLYFSLTFIKILETFLDLHEIRSEVMDQSTESKAIPPGCGHVLHLHPRIAFGHSSAPYLQSLCSSFLAHFKTCNIQGNNKYIKVSKQTLSIFMLSKLS